MTEFLIIQLLEKRTKKKVKINYLQVRNMIKWEINLLSLFKNFGFH